jgi:hypothetical protein
MGGWGASVSTARVACSLLDSEDVTAVTNYRFEYPIIFRHCVVAMFNRRLGQIAASCVLTLRVTLRLLFFTYPYGLSKKAIRLARGARLTILVADSLCPKKLSCVQKIRIDHIAWLIM